MTTKPTNADDGGATTDRAAALAANGKYQKANLADDLGHEVPGNAAAEPRMFISVPVSDIVRWRKKATKLQKKLAALEASRPAQDIVAEMRDRLELEIADCVKLYAEHRSRSKAELDDEWITADEIQHRIGGLKFALVILSPTKNTAPTEAEES